MKRRSTIIFALALALSLVLMIAGPMATPVRADESGPNNGSTAADEDSIGLVAWDDVSKSLIQDDVCAGAILTQADNTTHYLKVTGFGFAISGAATIQGIVVGVDRRESGTTLRVFDHSIRLVKGGTISGDDKSAGAAWPSSDTDEYAIYGNSTDLWGLNWTPADINSPDFGVAISAVKDDSAYNRNAFVDHIRMTIHYSVPKYYLTMDWSPGAGGDAFDDTDESPYEQDEEVQIRAEPSWGYEFVNWTADPSSEGNFADANAEETIFTMPAYNVTVIANFQLESGPQVIPTVTTIEASGITSVRATLNMEYTMGDFSPVYVRFAYKKSADSDWSFTPEHTKLAGGTYATLLTGLAADTEYDFKAQLRYAHIPIEGDTLQFTTDALSSFCFIATAAYGTPAAEQIDVLREFRDVVLLESILGSQFVALYYQFSPPVADFIAGNELLRTLVREFLIDPMVWIIQAAGTIWPQ